MSLESIPYFSGRSAVVVEIVVNVLVELCISDEECCGNGSKRSIRISKGRFLNKSSVSGRLSSEDSSI